MSQPVARDQSPRGELRRKRKAGEQRLPGRYGALEEQHRRRTRSDPNRQQTDQRIRKPRQTERHVIGGGFKNAATPWGQARRGRWPRAIRKAKVPSDRQATSSSEAAPEP